MRRLTGGVFEKENQKKKNKNARPFSGANKIR
jgi:hypothetical protein